MIITNCFPFLRHLPGDILGTRRIIEKAEWIRAVFWPPSQNNTGDETISIADMYLDEMAANEDKEGSSFTEVNIQSVLYDLRAAGIDTSAGTILWAILYLIRHPDIQRKMYEEIQTVVGLDNKPTIKDKQDLPFVEAVILETLRISTVAPLSVPHAVTRDTEFCGYFLPANCTVLTNLESVLKDPVVWENPDEFRPERFLSDDRSSIEIPEEFIPFSAGPRSCLGESLARIELFLVLVTLVQRFEFLPEKDGRPPQPDAQFGLTRVPCPYCVRVVKR